MHKAIILDVPFERDFENLQAEAACIISNEQSLGENAFSDEMMQTRDRWNNFTS